MKNKKILFFFFALLFGNLSFAAEIVLQGWVKDTQDKTPLAYVNIGVINTSIGTVTSPNGSFKLYINTVDGTAPDTIRFSHIGYRSIDVSLAELKEGNGLEILLEPQITPLDIIQVSAARLYPKTLGCQKIKTKMNTSFSISNKPNQNLGAAIGKKFKSKRKRVMNLDTLGFYIRQNNFDTVRFRVNIYQVKKGKPGDFLNSKPILIELVNWKKGWVEIDLKPYDLKSNRDIIASVEWIYHSERGRVLQMPIVMPRVGASHYYRYGSQNKWKRFRGMSTAMYLKVKTE